MSSSLKTGLDVYTTLDVQYQDVAETGLLLRPVDWFVDVVRFGVRFHPWWSEGLARLGQSLIFSVIKVENGYEKITILPIGDQGIRARVHIQIYFPCLLCWRENNISLNGQGRDREWVVPHVLLTEQCSWCKKCGYGHHHRSGKCFWKVFPM